MIDRPILYSFRRCPYAMRARMALLVSEAVYDHREVLLRDKPAAMLAASPKGTVPVLILNDGTVIDESIDVMRWALAQHDPEDWLAAADAALIAAFDGGFKHHLDRYKYPDRYDGDPLVHRDAGLAMLAELGTVLADQAYLGGEGRRFSDIALFPFVRQFAAVDATWFELRVPTRVQDWLKRLMLSDLFDQAMVKHPRWTGSPQ